MNSKILSVIGILIMCFGLGMYLKLHVTDFSENKKKEQQEVSAQFMILNNEDNIHQQAKFSLDSINNWIANPLLTVNESFNVAQILCEQCKKDSLGCIKALLQLNYLKTIDTNSVEIYVLQKKIYEILGDTISARKIELKNGF